MNRVPIYTQLTKQKRKKMSKLEPKTVLIIDGNNMAYRAYYKFGQLSTIDGTNTSITYGIPFIIKSLVTRLNPDMVVAVFDGGRSKHRLKLLPDYKGTRGNKVDFDRDDFNRQKEEVIQGLINMGIPVAMNPKEEADDIIYMVHRLYVKQGIDTIIIVSADKDFNQLANRKGTVIHNPSSGENITVNNCIKLLGYTPDQLVDYLSITGDKSDNIPGLDGIGEKRASQFLEKYGSIKNYLKNGKEERMFPKDKLRETYKRNSSLISLRKFYINHMRHKKVNWVNNAPFPRFNLNAYKDYCIKNQLTSFTNRDFMQVFKSLNIRMFNVIKKK